MREKKVLRKCWFSTGKPALFIEERERESVCVREREREKKVEKYI